MLGSFPFVYWTRLRWWRLALLLNCILWVQTLTPQTPGISGENVFIKRIPLKDVLSSSWPTCITQDSRGFMWLGAGGALWRYDGEKSIGFGVGNDTTGLSDGNITALYEDRDGFLWVGTMRGLNKFDPPRLAIEKYFHDYHNPSSLSHDEIRSIFKDRSGMLWVGTAHGLNKLDRNTGTWSRYFPNAEDTAKPGDNFITTILEDREGTLWIGSGSYLLRGGGTFTLDRSSGKFSSVGSQLPVLTMFEDASGELWVSMAGPKLYKVESTTRRFVPVPLPARDVGSPILQGVKSICEDKSGSLWMATWGMGLLRYDQRTRIFSRYVSDPSDPRTISGSELNAVYTDRSGLVWVVADKGGLSTVSRKPFLSRHTVGASLQLRGLINIFLADSFGSLWIAPREYGLWRYDPASQRVTQVLPEGLVGRMVQDSDGTIWITEAHTLLRYDPFKHTLATVWRVPTRQGLTDRLHDVSIDNEGYFWLATLSSLFRVRRDFKEYTVFVHDPQNPRSITAGQVGAPKFDRHGNIWVQTSEGLSRFDRGTQSFKRFLHDEKDSSSLSDNRWCHAFLDKSGTFWVATLDGLNRFHEESSSFTRYYPGDKRTMSMIGELQDDERGNLWFSALNLITKFEPATRTFTTFDQSDGIEENMTILHWSHTRLTSGELVFGAMDGMVVFHPDSVRVSSFVPPIVITGVRKSGVQVDRRTVEIVRELSLNHDENIFSISYTALSYDMPEFNQYAYKLEGFDKDWAYVGNKREATYTNLDPGEYVFRVKGSNHDGVWNETGASLLITVQPAYWQTWWFKLFIGLVIVGLAGFVYRRETHRLKKEKTIQEEFSRQQIESQEAERKRLAAELHDGLGQDLLVMNNELQQFMQENIGSREELKQVASLVQESIEGVREISANLHPHHLERLGLRAAIEAMVEKVSRSSGLTVRLVGDTIDRSLPKETEIHVYRIIQEALSNIVRHASAKNVTVQVKKNPESIEITVADDGKGFDVNQVLVRRPSRPSGEGLHGFGLSSMTERVRIVGGTMKIESVPGSGTTVHVTLPLL